MPETEAVETKELELPKQRYIINTRICPNFTPQMFDPYYWINRGRILNTSSGRGTAYFVDAGPGGHWVLRHYLRGGLMAHFLKDRYMYPGRRLCRPYREFRLLAELLEKGLPVPEPVAAHVNLDYYPLARYDIITRRVDNSRDLAAVMAERDLTDQELERLGEALVQLRDNKVHHRDLNIRNILLDDNGKFWFIDFDRGSLGGDHFGEMLQRLRRSLAKEKTIKGSAFNWNDERFSLILRSCS